VLPLLLDRQKEELSLYHMRVGSVLLATALSSWDFIVGKQQRTADLRSATWFLGQTRSNSEETACGTAVEWGAWKSD
jgi:hypothetical protein